MADAQASDAAGYGVLAGLRVVWNSGDGGLGYGRFGISASTSRPVIYGAGGFSAKFDREYCRGLDAALQAGDAMMIRMRIWC